MWQPRKWGTKAILARMRMRDRKNKQTVIRFIHEYWWRYLFDNISAPPFLCRAKRSFRDLCILWELSYYFHIQKWFFFTNCLLERSKCPALEWCWSILLYWCISNCQKSFVHWYLLELLYDFHHFLQTKWQIRRRQLFMFEKSIVFFPVSSHHVKWNKNHKLWQTWIECRNLYSVCKRSGMKMRRMTLRLRMILNGSTNGWR